MTACFKSLLLRAPFLSALHILNSATAVLIYALIKYYSPTTYMIDPTHNPFFFAYYMLAGNSEWWAYFYLFRSLISNLTSGIHRTEDRGDILFTARVNKVTRAVPIVDLVGRLLLWIIPGLAGGATNNSGNTLVWSVFLFSGYNAV